MILTSAKGGCVFTPFWLVICKRCSTDFPRTWWKDEIWVMKEPILVWIVDQDKEADPGIFLIHGSWI